MRLAQLLSVEKSALRIGVTSLRRRSDMAVRKTEKGKSLKKWFKEDWRDVKTGKKCGRSGKNDKRKSYPACRPASQAKSKAAKAAAKKKTGPKRISWGKAKYKGGKK